MGYTIKMKTEDLESKTIETYDATAHHWTRTHMRVNEWEWAAGKLKQLLPSGRVLEIGCGGGRDASELINLGYEYLGTDASIGMIRAAQKEVSSANFRQLNIYDLSSLNEQFDGFWACAVLLHIPKARIDEAFTQLSSCLKPGAIGMISIKDGDKEDFEVRDKDGGHVERLFVYSGSSTPTVRS
jgi:2-polyprenyl-3-methyl-5-hydroxy-6-metoxy-1,4-benzoquinol methylase